MQNNNERKLWNVILLACYDSKMLISEDLPRTHHSTVLTKTAKQLFFFPQTGETQDGRRRKSTQHHFNLTCVLFLHMTFGLFSYVLCYGKGFPKRVISAVYNTTVKSWILNKTRLKTPQMCDHLYLRAISISNTTFLSHLFPTQVLS